VAFKVHELWSQLKHVGVVELLGRSAIGCCAAYVLEDVPFNLESLIYRQPIQLASLDTVTKITLDFMSGLSYLHTHNVIHRNIRPRSIYLTHNMTAKIGDLDVAKFQKPGEENTPETGAYRYMAPEVVLHQPYSTKCDVYSFAMTWFELLHLRPPLHEYKAAQAAFHAVYSGARPEPLLSPEFSFFGDLLNACWDADPEKRPEPSEITEKVVSGLLMDTNVATGLRQYSTTMSTEPNTQGPPGP